MIIYDPIAAEGFSRKVQFKPRTCFLATQMGKPIPHKIKNILQNLKKYLKQRNFNFIDANSKLDGKDFLFKIWEMILSVPIGIAIISEEINPYTLSNIFYEIGLLQAYGKETLIIKTKECFVQSDFVRTGYLEYGRNFKKDIKKFFDGLEERGNYYATMAEQLEGNPLLSIDYLRRAFLITNNTNHRIKAQDIRKNNNFDKQTNSWLKNFPDFS
jgi:hypothetical protein